MLINEHCETLCENKEGHVAIVYGTNKIVVDRKQGCFSGMERSVSGLVNAYEVEAGIGKVGKRIGERLRGRGWHWCNCR